MLESNLWEIAFWYQQSSVDCTFLLQQEVEERVKVQFKGLESRASILHDMKVSLSIYFPCFGSYPFV